MSFRRFVLVTHRWLGLSSALVLAIAGLTGAVLLWAPGGFVRGVSGPLHEELAIGTIGRWLVTIATGVAVLLEAGGVILWWKTKGWRVRFGSGLRTTVSDLHYLTGIAGLVIMLIIAVSGVLAAFVTPEQPTFRRILMTLHTARDLSVPLKVIYTAGTLGFVVQGVTGFLMWWMPRTFARRVAPARQPAL